MTSELLEPILLSHNIIDLTGTAGPVGSLTMSAMFAEGTGTALDINTAYTQFLRLYADGGGGAPEIFSDDFESGNLTADGWTETGAGSTSGGASFSGAVGAQLKKSTTLEKAVSTVGYSNINVSYARRAISLDGGENLRVQWSTGGSWTTLETLNTTAYATASFVLPAGANNQSGFRIRFITNASKNNEKAYIDDVLVTGE